MPGRTELTFAEKLNQFTDTIEKNKATYERAAAHGFDVDANIVYLRDVLGRSDKLMDCTVASVCQAFLEAATLGLSINSVQGNGYIVPYKRRATFQVGYQGLLQLAYNDGRATTAAAEIVHEGDELSYALGTRPYITHIPIFERSRDRKALCCYAVIHAGGPPFVAIAGIDDLEDHADQYVRKTSDSLYETNREVWYKKTMLRRVLKFVPVSATARAVLNREEWHDAGIDANRMQSGDEQQTDDIRQIAEAALANEGNDDEVY